MSLESSGISWTDGTLNSLYGCSACSVGCRLCYAVKRVYRHSCNPRINQDSRFDGLVQGKKFSGKVLFDPRHLYKVIDDRKPKRIFVNEFSDHFHDALPLDLILEHVRVIRRASWSQFQILTRRGRRLAEVDKAVLAEFGAWPDNLWLGVSACSPLRVEMERIEALGATAAKVKWVSLEPWISDLSRPLRRRVPALRNLLRKNQIGWSVIGGESGSRNETSLMTLDDAVYLVEESKDAGCKVHFKQLGTALAIQRGVYSTKGEHRAKGGSPDQWPDELNIQEWPETSPVLADRSSGFIPRYEIENWHHYDSAG